MNALQGPHGPYQAAGEARADAADVYAQARARNNPRLMGPLNIEALLGALAAARVELGTYDRRIVGWLAGWEPEVVQVVIGWIERAHAKPF